MDDFNPPIADTYLHSYVYAVALQLDGKVLAAGTSTNTFPRTRYYLARVNPDGSVGAGFNPTVNGTIYCITVQPDGKILIGGDFSRVCEEPRSCIARLNPDGSLDTSFNPGASSTVYCLVPLPDGRLLVGGGFMSFGGQARNRIARLNPDGSLDETFTPNVVGAVFCMAMQADGKILVGGTFSTLNGQTRSSIARLNADGTLDPNFNPGPTAGPWRTVLCLAVQPNGKIIVGGAFTTLAGQTRNNFGRLNPDGTLDEAFNLGANSAIYSLALQADGRVVVGGGFTTLAGQTQRAIGRLSSDGTADAGFTAVANGVVYSVTCQPDGKIIAAGNFTTLGGANRNRIGRLESTAPVTENLSVSGSTVTWLRGGTGPEVWRTTLEASANGVDWSDLRTGMRVPGGWDFSAVSVPMNSSIRARGYVAQGYQNSSSWFVETIAGMPGISLHPLSQTNNAGTTTVFHVVGGGTPPLSHQWRKGQVVLSDDSPRITGSQTPTLVLSNVLSADSGPYSLVISNLSGIVTSAVAALTVVDPAINVQPLAQTANVGYPLTLSVGAGGTPPLNYQWRKNGTNLIGATESLLHFGATEWTHGGDYQVLVSNTLGSATSAVAAVAINMAPPDSFDPGLDGSAYSAIPQVDARILVGGFFTTLGGQARKALGRLHADGSLDTSFGVQADGVLYSVYSIAFQEDGAVLVGGEFSMLGGQTKYFLGRIRKDGQLDDSFAPGSLSGSVQYVNCLAIQTDQKILAGGLFTIMGGQPRANLCRLNPDGTADTTFNPGAGGVVRSFVVQPDGKLIVCGGFTTLGGQPCSRIGRLHASGTRDTEFNATADSAVNCAALQPDGKILVGGNFSSINGQPRSCIARLHPDGAVDETFNPVITTEWFPPAVNTIVLQADRRILIGGTFTTMNAEERNYLGRLNPDGTLDPTFNVPANRTTAPALYSLALQPDGGILVSGSFTGLGGATRTNLARLQNSDPATQALSWDGSAVTWQRGGSGPEVSHTVFEATTNGVDWIPLGEGARMTGGWQLSGVVLPPGATIRARGYAAGGRYNGSAYLVESWFPGPLPLITVQPQSQTVVAGANLLLSVGAGGTGLFSYQWWFGGAPMPGQTNDTLSILSVQRTNAGAYSVVVSNQFGTVTSDQALIRVLIPPVLEPPLLLSDGTLRLQFRDSDGLLPADLGNVTVQWRTNLPFGSDTNWEVLTAGFSLTNGFLQINDTNAWNTPTKFFRVLER